MPVCVEPINFQTGAIFLSAPASATLYVKNVHVETRRLAPLAHLGSRGALFENVIVDRVYGPKRFSGYIGIWNADAERLFHTHNQLQCVDRIKAQSVRTEKRQVITYLLGSNLQHQIFDQHLL